MTPVTPETYARVFEGMAEGQLILEDLARRFYDRPSFVPGKVDVTSYNEGQRAVIGWIIGQIQQTKPEVIDVRDEA